MAVEFGKWQKIERKELTPPIPFGVEKIEILNLDEGSKNDGLETLGNYGMIYGKSYKLRVSKFAHNIAPKNKNDIKWQAVYLGKGDILTLVHIEKTGDEIVFYCDNLDYCGQTISFYAFVRESGKEQNNKAKLEVFCHNRFRWLDKKVFEKELSDRTDNRKPYLINQRGTSLCGMACIFYLFAKEQSEKYKKFARDLFRKGEATCNNYTASPSKELFEKKRDKNNFPYNKLGFMPIVDFITLAGVRNTENSSYKGGNQEFQAINWPWLMTMLCEKLLGYKNVHSQGCYFPIKEIHTGTHSHLYTIVFEKLINEINILLSQKFHLMLLIDSDMINYTEDYTNLKDFVNLEYHWVVLEAPIGYNKQSFSYNSNLTISVFSWGGCFTSIITLEHFIKNYYGYIKIR